MNYLFAGKETAAKRLEKLHKIFFKSSEIFVRNNVKSEVNVCIDLGCGIGHTTRDITFWIDSLEYFGLDKSSHFIERAKDLSKNYSRVRYKLHDITKIPFPCKRADVIYTRFLLTHLENPVECIKKWGAQLNSKGVLLLEETDSIKTNVLVFQKYITIVDAMLKSNENVLYIGKFLDSLDYEPDLRKKFSEVREVPAAVNDAAGMFLLNMSSWKNHDFIRENYGGSEICEMENELSNLVEGDSNNNDDLFIEWDLRQIVLVKN